MTGYQIPVLCFMAFHILNISLLFDKANKILGIKTNMFYTSILLVIFTILMFKL